MDENKEVSPEETPVEPETLEDTPDSGNPVGV